MATKKTPNGGATPTRANPFANHANSDVKAHLADISRLGLACDAVLSEGCAIMFGLTRDGGALVVTLLDGEQRHRTYCANTGELERALASIEFAYSPD